MSKKISIIAILILCIVTVYAQEAKPKTAPKTIEVTGSAEKEVIPDEFIVRVDLKEFYKNKDKVELEALKSSFFSACKKSGIADSNITISDVDGATPEYWKKRTQRKEKDEAVQSITYFIKFNTAKAIELFTEKLEPDSIYSLKIERYSYSKMTELRKELKVLAIKAAKAKAKYLCEAIDENVGAAIYIKESNANPYSNYFAGKTNIRVSNGNVFGKDENSGDNISFKKISYYFEVEVIFEIK